MKIRLSICLLFAMILCFGLQAQDRTYPQIEVMLGAGVNPLISDIFAYDAAPLDYGYKYYSNKKIYSPSVNLTYAYRFKKWFALSGVLGYSTVCEKYYDIYTDKKHATETQHRVTVMPVARFYWYNSRIVSLYSSLGMGVTYSALNNFQGNTQCNSSETLFAVHFAPVGIIAGHRLFGYAELSVGMLGVFQAGIGYRF